MIEKNRDILSNALKDMPTRRPKPSNWDNITDNLDKLEAGNFMSKHKESLPLHKAPENAWPGITKGLTTPFSAILRSGPAKLISILVILGGLTAAFLLLTPSSNNEIIDQEQSSNPVEAHEAPEIIEPDRISDLNEPEQTSNPIEPEQPVLVPEKDNSSIQLHYPKEDQPAKEPEANNSLPFINDIVYSTHIDSGNEIARLTPKSPTQLMAPSEESEKPILYRSTGKYSDKDNYYIQDFSSPKFSVGLYYSYNQFQKVEYEGMSVPHNLSSFGFEVEYEKRDWFIKIGLGYLNWNEEGNYIIDYDQMQMIYSYNYVDSAHVNPENGEINYYTTKVEVFDSVAEQIYDQATYNYQSLQIPILFGYKLIERSKFNVALLGGVAFDFKISGKQYVPEFNEENASITQINNSLIYRTKTNWRLIFGLNINYNISELWSLYAEPTYQQYMSPIYTPNSIKGGGMLNIKLGIKYSF